MSAKISRASRAWLVATGLFVSLGVLSYVMLPEGAARRHAMSSGFDLQGHRGARGLFPENSLPGFEGALALGVTTLEMDLGMTRDGVLVVHHDRRLDPERTRGPDGVWLEEPGPMLVELDFAALQVYDLGRLRPGSRHYHGQCGWRKGQPQEGALHAVPHCVGTGQGLPS